MSINILYIKKFGQQKILRLPSALASLLTISRDIPTIRIGKSCYGVDTKTTAGKSLPEGAPVFSVVPRLLGLDPCGARCRNC